MSGRPKAGQTLDEVKDILLEQADKLRKGEFSDDPRGGCEGKPEAYRAEKPLRAMIRVPTSMCRLLSTVCLGLTKWQSSNPSIRLPRPTSWLRLTSTSSRKGMPYSTSAREKTPTSLRLPSPSSPPIVMNRDKTSPFLAEIQNSVVEPIEPVFADYAKDLATYKAKKNVPLIYMPNTKNDIFQLIYVYDLGTYADSLLQFAPALIGYCGTNDMTPEQVKNEFYKLACSFSYSGSGERTYAAL